MWSPIRGQSKKPKHYLTPIFPGNFARLGTDTGFIQSRSQSAKEEKV
jgi:hypothetical protein